MVLGWSGKRRRSRLRARMASCGREAAGGAPPGGLHGFLLADASLEVLPLDEQDSRGGVVRVGLDLPRQRVHTALGGVVRVGPLAVEVEGGGVAGAGEPGRGSGAARAEVDRA